MSHTQSSPSVMTANRLRSGEVVYLATNGEWSRALSHSRIATSEAACRDLEAAAARAVSASEVVAAYLMEIKVDAAGQPEPASMRERIRAQHGPSVAITPDHRI